MEILKPSKEIILPKNENVKRRILMDSKGSVKSDGGGGPKGTIIRVKNLDTGEEQIIHNKVTLPGAQFTAGKHFGLGNLINLPSYNKTLGLDNSVYTDKLNEPVICLFCMGNGGCGVEQSNVYEVDYKKRIGVSNLLPFRYQLPTDDLPTELRATYYGRLTGSDHIAYYFKKFETDPEMHAVFSDGTILDENIFDSSNSNEASFYVETTLKVEKEDFRDYYIATTGINSAVVNQLSLIQGWYNTDGNGIKWYQDTLPVTQLNFSNESLIDLTKGIEFTYQIYY